MTTRYLFQICLVLVIFLPSCLFSQTEWCPPGAVWHYRVYDPAPETRTDGIIVFTYEGDTVIGGAYAKKVNSKFYGMMYTYTPIGGVAEYKQQVTKAAGDVIYVNLPGTSQFDTIVNFDARPGDRWRAPRRYECQNRRIMEVVDTGHIKHASFNLRTVRVTFTVTDLQQAVTYTTTFTERMYTAALKTPCFDMFAMSCDNPVPQHCEVATFRCYVDEDFSLYNTSTQPCSDFVGIPEDASVLRLQVYPNPFVDGFTLSGEVLEHPGTVCVVQDLRGIEVASATGDGQKVYIGAGQFPAGLYILEIFRDGEVIMRHRLIRSQP